MAPHSTLQISKTRFQLPSRRGVVFLSKKLHLYKLQEDEKQSDRIFHMKRERHYFFKKEKRRYTNRMRENAVPIFLLPKKYHILHTNDEEEFRDWVQKEVIQRGETFVGVDSEWTYYLPQNAPAEVVQISTADSGIVFSTGGQYSDAVIEFFQMHNVKKIFIGASQDYGKLCNSKEVPESIIDISIGDEESVNGGLNVGAYDLVYSLLGKCLKKNPQSTLSRWGREVLDDWQLEYGATDAYINYRLYQTDTMRARVEKYGNNALGLYKHQEKMKKIRSKKKKLRRMLKKVEKAVDDNDVVEAVCE